MMKRLWCFEIIRPSAILLLLFILVALSSNPAIEIKFFIRNQREAALREIYLAGLYIYHFPLQKIFKQWNCGNFVTDT